MTILTPEEKAFLEVFIHEASTSPFGGPATDAIHKFGVAYSDIPSLAWAYNREAPCTIHGWGTRGRSGAAAAVAGSGGCLETQRGNTPPL